MKFTITLKDKSLIEKLFQLIDLEFINEIDFFQPKEGESDYSQFINEKLSAYWTRKLLSSFKTRDIQNVMHSFKELLFNNPKAVPDFTLQAMDEIEGGVMALFTEAESMEDESKKKYVGYYVRNVLITLAAYYTVKQKPISEKAKKLFSRYKIVMLEQLSDNLKGSYQICEYVCGIYRAITLKQKSILNDCFYLLDIPTSAYILQGPESHFDDTKTIHQFSSLDNFDSFKRQFVNKQFEYRATIAKILADIAENGTGKLYGKNDLGLKLIEFDFPSDIYEGEATFKIGRNENDYQFKKIVVNEFHPTKEYVYKTLENHFKILQ